jgi:hypothetical protein
MFAFRLDPIVPVESGGHLCQRGKRLTGQQQRESIQDGDRIHDDTDHATVQSLASG